MDFNYEIEMDFVRAGEKNFGYNCTDNFNAYLALSNFSNFTTNTHGTPNTRFFMVIFF